MLHKKVDQWYKGDPKSKTHKVWVAVSGEMGEICWHIAHSEAILTLM
jgi:hypothetical protein